MNKPSHSLPTLEQAAEELNTLTFNLLPPGKERQQLLAGIAQLISCAARDIVQLETSSPVPPPCFVPEDREKALHACIASIGYNAFALRDYPYAVCQRASHVLGMTAVQMADLLNWSVDELVQETHRLAKLVNFGDSNEKPN